MPDRKLLVIPIKVAIGATIIILAACNTSPLTYACTAEFRYGLGVKVQDSVSGAWIGSGATLVAVDGDFRDSVAFPAGRPDLDAQPLPTAGERAGTYSLTLTREGYATWVRSGVTVTAGRCHVNTMTITARLVPQ